MSKRLVYAPDLESFKYFLMNKNIEIPDVPEAGDLRTNIDNLSTGCFILAVKVPKGEGEEPLTEGIVMHKFTKAVNMMVSRENIFGLHLRYLSKQERESVAKVFDLEDQQTK